MTQVHGTGLLRQIRKVVAAQCPSRQSDVQLLQQFLADHDEASFAAVVRRHGVMVLGVCRHVLRHQQDAEDVFQAVFLVLARKAHTIRKYQALSSWLHGVAYRLALKARMRRSRQQARDQAAPMPEAIATGDDLTVREVGTIMHAELEGLAEAHRAALVLCYWEGKTRDEAAEQLGMTAGVFKKRLERARKLLRARLMRRGVVPSTALLAMLVANTNLSTAAFLIHTTAQAAVAYAAGQSAAAASSAAVALAEGAIRAMNLTRWTMTMLMALFLGTITTALGLASYHALWGKPGGAVAAAAQDQGKETPKSDKERIVGIWRLANGVADGRSIQPDATTLARIHFTKDGQAIMMMLGEPSNGKYKLMGTGKMDVVLNPRDALAPAIYQFDGDDRLTLCIVKDSAGKRPTEFTGAKDSGQVLLQLARAKPGEEKPTREEIARFQDPAGKVQEAVTRTNSALKLKMIGLAMHNYHDQHGAPPLHAIYSKDGKTPLLSWRVALLPYLEHEALYKEFKLDEPWDSDHNKKLIAKMPPVYKLNVGEKEEGTTYYQVITGPDTVFDGQKKMPFPSITDGTSNTLLAVEARDPVVWTKPADLTLPKEKDKLPPVGGLFKNGFHILLCDGSVRMMPHNTEPALFRAIVTPRGGERIDP
jgi:RNA polymerase sigma factor (sigma-70 family)